MHYQITHHLTYTYPYPVILNPHLLRLCPRSDSYQHLANFSLQIHPTPQGTTDQLDSEGNLITRCWWSEQTTETLSICATSTATTRCTNPFAYVLEPWATHLPIDYPRSLMGSLHSYLADPGLGNGGADPVATQLAQEIAHDVNGNTVQFLGELNQRIYQHCQYEFRETGDPYPPHLTWKRQAGSCRDFVVLFMAACRAVGLAARFVSGYEEGDPAYAQALHAWVEVFLPGAGWRSYDPTLGIAVSDHHVAVAATGWPRHAAPVTGTHRGGNGAASILNTKVSIQPQPEP